MTSEEFVESLNLVHFTHNELFKFTKIHPNSEPDPRLRKNIVPSILIVKELRKQTGVPILITSTYRNELYNRKVGGAPKSLHQAFAALDIRIDKIYKGDVTVRDLYDILLTWREEGKWFKSPVCISTHPVTLSNDKQTPHQCLDVRKIGDEYEFKFMGGLGYYSKKSTYIHIDTRGINAELTPEVKLRKPS